MRPTSRDAVLVTLALLLALTGTVAVPTSAATPAPAAASQQHGRPRFSWPLRPEPAVTRAFDPPDTDFGSGHRGVDLAATPGQQVLAADAGVVVYAGPLAGRGVISIQHAGGLRTTYEPVKAVVDEGAQVYRGQVIGTVVAGHPECSVEACLHWGVRTGEDYLDPLMLVRAGVAIRLKPWDGEA